jgi:hypothetical protein
VADTWADVTSDDEQRWRSIKRLLQRADRLGAELAAMGAWSLEAVRMLRLFVRFSARMTPRQRERVCAVASNTPLDHPETADLFVEIARAGDRAMVGAIFADDDLSSPDDLWAPEVGDEQALVARLADVVDDGPTHGCRVVALELISRFALRDSAASALRRALRLPSFAVRARALDALSTSVPALVEPGDVVHVLRDLVAHAPPDYPLEEEHEDNERIFAEAVIAALEHAPSDQAAELLLDWIDAGHDSLWLDAGWATEALAVSHAETSAAMVDHWLKCARAYDRMRALAALSRLPAPLAEPRLRVATNDPAASVREGARRIWAERFGSRGQALSEGAEGLVAATLLGGSPTSDSFAARLAVVHGRVAEARQAMARALLDEAPDREALVLLLELASDDTEFAEPLSVGKEGGLALAIAERFGEVGVRGLAAIAARFPEPESFGWMRRLGDLVEKGAIRREDAESLRALASAHVSSDDSGQTGDALRVLSLVGAPPELLERVLSLALDDSDLGAWEARKLVTRWADGPYAAGPAGRAADRAVDTRLASEMALALAERKWERLQYASWMALTRRSASARVIAQRVLEIAERDEDAVEAASECARGLLEMQALDDSWALSVLARPEAPAFTVAARSWRKSLAARPALEAALSSSARGGASAVDAAVALLGADPPLAPRDKRLAAVLSAAAPAKRAELVLAMCVHGASLTLLAPHLEELMPSTDPAVTQSLLGVPAWLKSPRAHALLRCVLPRVVDEDLRAEIEQELGAQPAPYWVDFVEG